MDKWPQELYDHVVSFVERVWHPTLPSAYPAIAAVSRKFQAAIERRSFHHLHIYTTKERLDRFKSILTPRRRNILRILTVSIILPSYPAKSFFKFETDEDRRANNKAATAAMGRLFRILAGNDSQYDESMTPVLDLKIRGIYSPSDQLSVEREPHRERYAFSLLDLTSEVSKFPPLPRVRSFCICRTTKRAWNPRVAMSLTAKMVKATHVEWRFPCMRGYQEKWNAYPSLDRMFRDDLVDSIKSAELPASVTTFSCDLISPATKRYHALPRFVAPGEYDPVSCALRRLTRNCTDIFIDGPMHLSLFDPPAGVLSTSQPCWQDTTRLQVRVDMQAPDGSWLFQLENGVSTPNRPGSPTDLDRPPPGYWTTEEEREEAEEYYAEHLGNAISPPPGLDRKDPKDADMNALLAAFARACFHMPALQLAVLDACNDNDDGLPFRVSCVAPGNPYGSLDKKYANGSDSWRVYLHVDEWRPTEATMEEFKRIGRARNGENPKVCFLPWGIYD
ncbi:hypothetical protein F4820DRAFT_85854 [Hypoxylon rubiginosum]|uniref:Uncharacterized protein n=1 Tax=Hypoxylon rubiginosum TaxID=110542 RepID=A0ACB9YP63_9PEZI|nr:hypothetical protein F4820DRAFT_85854 [Hypoxylon rubiginosum]